MIAWSWSRLTAAEKCLKMFRSHNILKDVKFVENEAMKRGSALHKKLQLATDNYKEHKLVTYDSNTNHVMPLIQAVCDAHNEVHTELQIAFREDLSVCGWFDKQTWLRAILDVTCIEGTSALVVDWKTGQVRFERDQLKLFALVALLRWPKLEEVRTSLVFVDHKQSTPIAVYKREWLETLLAEFSDRAEIIQIAERNGDWPASPGSWCGWQCALTKAQCEHAR